MRVSNTVLGLIVGLALALAGAFGGFGAFLLVLVLGVGGLVVGRYLARAARPRRTHRPRSFR